jgi:glucose/arabinose dehydrogenase
VRTRRSSAAALVILLLACVSLAGCGEIEKKPAPAANVSVNPITVDPASYLDRIKLPPGFSISIYAADVKGARSMALSPNGTLFVGTRSDSRRQPIGSVYAIPNPEGATRAEQVITVAQDLNYPNGVAFRDGDLYVAELQRISRYENIESRLDNPPPGTVINDTFPTTYHHGWKYLDFGPDGRLYVSVGAPCNTCEPEDGEGGITTLRADGSDKQIYARGIRNSVGFAWDPGTGDLWFTDNGRDIWGDDIPPEELNHAPGSGLHFGFPYRYGKTLLDEDFSTDMKAEEFTPPALEFPAHNALLGMDFNSGSHFPEDYSGSLFIASHGSWNRSIPDGYRIYEVKMRNGQARSYRIFADGWLTEDKQFWGRPVDIQFMADGSMLVSDDFANVIYRISYTPDQ